MMMIMCIVHINNNNNNGNVKLYIYIYCMLFRRSVSEKQTSHIYRETTAWSRKGSPDRRIGPVLIL